MVIDNNSTAIKYADRLKQPIDYIGFNLDGDIRKHPTDSDAELDYYGKFFITIELKYNGVPVTEKWANHSGQYLSGQLYHFMFSAKSSAVPSVIILADHYEADTSKPIVLANAKPRAWYLNINNTWITTAGVNLPECTNDRDIHKRYNVKVVDSLPDNLMAFINALITLEKAGEFEERPEHLAARLRSYTNSVNRRGR